MADENLIKLLNEIKIKLDGFVKDGGFEFPVSEEIQELWKNKVSIKFTESIHSIKSEKYDDILEDVGLSGNLLQLKFNIWEEIKAIKEIKEIREKVFMFINSLLSSLSAIPGFELVKEFKDMIHISLK